MRRQGLGFTLLAFVLSASVCFAQQAGKVTNYDITDLVSAGMSDKVILDKIHAAPATDFDTSAQALKALKAANVSDTVIGAMINPTPAAFSNAPITINSDPNNPAAPHDPGIYMYAKGDNGVKQMTLLEPTVYQGTAAGSVGFMLSFGIAKVKAKAVVRGAHATVKSNDSSMVFYFYFEEANPGLSYASYDIPTTPNEFTLLKFEQKNDSREIVIMKANAFGSSVGTDEKASTSFTFTKLKSGVYKVTPNSPLSPGEYCFLSPSRIRPHEALPSGTSRLFDFEVLP